MLVNDTPRLGASGNLKLMSARAFATVLAGSAALLATTAPASAATCNATSDGQYDACVTGFLSGDTINVNSPAVATHQINFTTGGILNVNSGASLTDIGFGGQWGTGLALTIATGGAMGVDGLDPSGFLVPGFTNIDTFASLAGGGSLTVTTGGVAFGGNNANTAFSGTVIMPTLNQFLLKLGSGTITVNGMTMAEGEFLVASGGLANTTGTTNIKSIALGTGTGSSALGTISGGTLNITGNFVGAPPCGSNCPALRIGDFFGVGVLNQTNGTINVGAAGVGASINIGNQGGNGTYNMSGGILNLGVLGDVNSAGLYAIGRQASASAAQNNGTTTGVFNISGGVVNVNAGELINGDRDAGGALNVTTNSTINLSGGTLSVKNGANLWLSAFDNNAAIDSTFNLSGTGILEVGDGRLQSGYLGGTGAYAFNLNGGTIRVIDTALLTSVNATLQGATAATGTQIDTNGLGATWNGVLSGTGWIVKTGLGTLNLGGVNTYTGGTAFNGGVVLVDATSDLGATTSAMSFNGGTLRLGASAVLAPKTGGVNMAGAGTIDLNGNNDTLAGNITGSGALTVSGGAFLNLSGNNNAHSGALLISGAGTTVNGAGTSNAIGDTSAVTIGSGARLWVNNGIIGNEVIGSLASTGGAQVEIINGSLTTGGNNSSTTYNGTILQGGVGSLFKTGSGTFTVNGNLTYTGLTTVNGGTMILNGVMSDSLLVAAGTTFGGNATVSGNLTNNGVLSPGNSPGTINVLGNYIGGGSLNAEVIFNSAGAPVNGTTHDFLNITGNVTNTTLINVIPFAPSTSAQPTTGNGIELVQVGGTTAANSFALAAPVFVGAYEYTLNYLPNFSGTLDGYFLQSRLNESFLGEAAVAAANQALIAACFDGDELPSGDGDVKGHAWARVTTGNRKTGADTGLDQDQNYTCGSGGVDVRVGNNLRIGVTGGYGDTSSDVATSSGIGSLDGNGSVVEAYLSLGTGHFYMNALVGYGSTDWTYDGALTAPVSTSLSGIVGGVQLGAGWPLSDHWKFGVVGEANYNDMNCDTSCLLAGTSYDVANWFMKGTLRLDGAMNDGKIKPFVAVSILNGNTNTVTNGTASLTTDTNATQFGAKAGASIMLGERSAFFINGGLIDGLDKDISGWDGNAGFKIAW